MRLPIIATCTFLSATLQAQDRGFISGTFALSTSNTDAEGSANDGTVSNGTFGPAIGYHLTPEHVVGLALTFNGSTSEYKINTSTANPLDVTRTSSLTTIAPFYRLMKPVNEKLHIYGQARLGFGFGREITDVEGAPSDTEVRVGTFAFDVGPGIYYHIADHWALSADWGLLGYSGRKETQEINRVEAVSKVDGFEARLDPATIAFALNWAF